MRDRVRGLMLRLRALFRRETVEEELDQELRFHLEMEAEKLLREGLSPEEARRRARLRFGGVERFKERSRDARGVRWMEDGMNDVRYGLRMLLGSPLFSVVAIMTLALGIGANTAIFSVVRAVLLEPLPFEEPDELVRLYTRNPVTDADHYFVSPREFDDWRTFTESLDELAGFWPTGITLTSDDGVPERLSTVYVTENYFALLGVEPLAGRTFTPEEGPGSLQVGVLSEGFWERRFGRDPGVVGRTLTLDGQPVEVVGVVAHETVYPEGTDLWINMNWSMRIQGRQARWLSTVGRMPDAGTLEEVRSDMASLARRLEADHPDANAGWSIQVEALVDEVVGETRGALLVLFGATALVLLIACANVANLLLSRSEVRSREISVRAAFGAGRGRLTRQLLVESVLLGLLGAVAGAALGWIGLRVLLSMAPSTIPRLNAVELDGMVLLLTVGVSVLTGLLFGMAPVARLLGGDLFEAMREGARGSGQLRQTRLQRGFVVAQVAVATTLVVGAGLLVRSFGELQRIDTGFQPGGLVTFELDVPPGRFETWAEVSGIYRQYVDRLRELPGVASVGLTSSLPLAENHDYYQPIGVEGVESAGEGEEPRAFLRQISPDLLEALRIPVLRGRGFTESDDMEAAGVALVNEAFAERYFPQDDAVGRRLSGTGYQIGPLGLIEPDETEIVGVVNDVRYDGLRQPAQPSVYFNYLQAPFRRMTVVIRSVGEPAPVVSGARRILAELVPDMAVSRVQTMADVVTRARARDRFSTTLLGVFGVVALLLAVVGVYGVLAYAVEQRVPEMGIRMALGADPAAVRRLVLGDGLRLAGLGLGLGLVAALLSGGVLSAQLYGVSPRDPAVYASVLGVLAAAALAAAWLPAHRATRIDPSRAMRAE